MVNEPIIEHYVPVAYNDFGTVYKKVLSFAEWKIIEEDGVQETWFLVEIERALLSRLLFIGSKTKYIWVEDFQIKEVKIYPSQVC